MTSGRSRTWSRRRRASAGRRPTRPRTAPIRRP
jgi:hypothetical protein